MQFVHKFIESLGQVTDFIFGGNGQPGCQITFAFGKASLQEEAKFSLVKVATILAKFPEMHIYVEGHTDDIGSEDANQKLSERRAQSVYEYLVGHFPQSKLDQYTVRGYGETRSIATNDTADGRSRNRRVEFRVMNREILRR